jgi:hypothetical protein
MTVMENDHGRTAAITRAHVIPKAWVLLPNSNFPDAVVDAICDEEVATRVDRKAPRFIKHRRGGHVAVSPVTRLPGGNFLPSS